MDCKKGLISVSIVTWNSEEFIEKCLNAVLSQLYHEVEIIITDNNSSDSTLEILKRYSSIILMQNDINKGFSGGHNIGIKRSTGEYILLLNPDVFLNRTYIQQLD